MAGPFARAAYALGQGARVGLFWGQYWLSARLTTPVKAPRPIEGPMPDSARILADLRRLMAGDWRNIEAGYYRLPHDLAETPVKALAGAARYFADLPAVERRRHRRDSQEVRREGADGEGGGAGAGGGLPHYYLQNFHFQTDGYLSRRSAELYDHQVEVLFGGGADAMRRHVLVPLHDLLKARRIAETRLIDLACGTGRFLTFLKDNYPRLEVTALDLSPAYLAKAREALRPWRGIEFLTAPAEASGLADESYELATCIFLFHELPRPVRSAVAREIARLLKPGGRLIFLDSLQLGDEPDYDGLLEYFPAAFHEPYYDDYIRQDLGALFEAAGFEVERVETVFFSRLMVLAKG
jgi:ubiquinone/menaquinone biosynthesis C-methylase UbiE